MDATQIGDERGVEVQTKAQRQGEFKENFNVSPHWPLLRDPSPLRSLSYGECVTLDDCKGCL